MEGGFLVGAMIVTRLKAANWRNFRKIDISLENRVFAVGPNASGKSNFLDIFAFLNALAKRGGGLFSAVEERGGFSDLKCRAGDCDSFEISVALGTEKQPEKWIYEIGVGCGSSIPFLRYERVFCDGEKILDRPEKADSEDPVRLEQTFLETGVLNSSFREIAVFFSETVQHSWSPTFSGGRSRRAGFSRIDIDDSAYPFFSELRAAPPEIRKNRIAKIERVLQLVLPQLKQLGYSKINESEIRLETVFDHWRPGEKLAQEHFSEGTLRLISILWTLLASRSLLLLEEPELSLHPSVVRYLPGLIYRMKRKEPGQTILTTHSPELLSDPGIDASEVILFLPEEEGVSVVSAADVPEAKALIDAGLSIGEIVLPRSEPARIEELGFFE